MKLCLEVCLAVIIFVLDVAKSDDVGIVYRRENEKYKKIYDDSGTGAWDGVSIWRPESLQSGFFALGDVAVPGDDYDQPTSSAVMVKDVSGDSLKPPSGFTEVWNDKGSKGDQAVRIMKMNPPSGYICLGDVAVIGYDNLPDKSLYRCVKEEYVLKDAGQYEWVWDDSGSKADEGVSMWSNRVTESDTHGIDSNTFTSFSEYSTSGSPDLLDGTTVVNVMDYIVDDSDFSLTVYEVSETTKIYDDSWTGAYDAISVWRAEGPPGTYILGDVAVPSYDKPVGFVVRPHNETVLSVPYDFKQIWNDAGSKGSLEGAFWKPLCNTGYRAIGHVAIRSETEKPDTSVFRCVEEKYTVPGKWEPIWTDEGSKAYDAVSIFRADVKDENGQAVSALTSFGEYGDPEATAYVLDASATNYKQGPPAVKFTLKHVNYHLDDYELLDDQPAAIGRTVVENKGDTEQVAHREIAYSYEESYSWSNAAGGEVGVELTVSAGIPFISKGEMSTSASATYQHDWGGSETETIEDKVTVDITVKACSRKAADVSGWRYKMDVPYDATLITEFADGSTSTTEDYKGVFRGVEVREVDISYGLDLPIKDEECSSDQPIDQ